jgi:hypothetical protein
MSIYPVPLNKSTTASICLGMDVKECLPFSVSELRDGSREEI